MVVVNSAVTIVIPTFNRKKYLNKAVSSALGQTRPCPVIVVDHGSNDGTKSMFRNPPHGLTYLRKEVDRGPHFCWLEGVLEAKTEYVKLLFDDDEIAPTFVEKCMDLFSPSVGFVFSRAKGVDRVTGRITASHFERRGFSTRVYSTRSLFGRKVRRWMLSPTTFIARRTDVLDALYQGNLPFAGPAYKGVGPDHFMKLICFLRYHEFGFVDEELAIFGEHPESITIDAIGSSEKAKSLRSAYQEVNFYYSVLRWASLGYSARKAWLRLRAQN